MISRRRLLIGTAGATLAASAGVGLWLAGEPDGIQLFPDLAAVEVWLDTLAGARSLTAWSVPHVIEHAAQSIEYSLDGYPELRSETFRASVGALAFAAFKRGGRMWHDTTEAIPGAPPLAATALAPAIARLRNALARFAAHPGAFAPHFAYGALDRDDYLRAHLMHLANHAREIVPA
jgi:hypothetical protein